MSVSPGVYGTTDDKESLKTLERAVELNSVFWDTANIYGNGHNEKFISGVLKENRAKIFICTKFGLKIKDGRLAITSENVRECCEESLQRLGVDQIDLYYQHRVDPKIPIEETVAAMAELVKEKKVRFLGLSECSAETLRRAYKVHPIQAIQVEYSPWSTDIENNGILEAARELGVSIVAYSPLGRGFLTGSYKSPADLEVGDWRRTNPRFSEENFPKNLVLVEEINKIAAKKGVTSSQLVLAWILAQGPEFILIPGTKHSKYLEENLKSLEVNITEEEEKAIRKAVDAAGVHGHRYVDMSTVNI